MSAIKYYFPFLFGISGLAMAQLSFEEHEGYAIGPVDVETLSVDQGSASVTNLRMLEGSQSVWGLGGEQGLSLIWDYESLASETVTYLSFALDLPSADSVAVYEVEAGGALMSFSQIGDQVILSLYDASAAPNSELPGQSHEIYTAELTSGMNWQRFTIRFDHESGYFDCYIDGQMIAADFPLQEGDSALSIQSQLNGELYLDRLAYLSQTLDFEDVDKDGLPDQWEAEHGLSLVSDDRYGDLDADGKSNLSELIDGSDASESESETGATDESTTTGHEGLTIFIAGRGYFTVTEQANRSPLFRQ